MPVSNPLDWNAIRPLNGSRAAGFEEFCAQLARAETPAGCRFERKGTPDGGVECYAVLNDGAEWGWQAKYFDGLGVSQWKQLDESVKTALEKHPKLVRYYVCVPLDRPDPRIERKRPVKKSSKKTGTRSTASRTHAVKSAKDRWDDHVNKWSRWASARGMPVEFIFWGSSELLERLSRPEHIGRIHFWFDVQGLDRPWFLARLEESLKAAGQRYTPEIHVDLPIAQEFEAFGRTPSFFDGLKALARPLHDELRSFSWEEIEDTDPDVCRAATTAKAAVHAALRDLDAISFQPIGELPLGKIAAHVNEAAISASEVARLLSVRERAHEQVRAQLNSDDRVAREQNPHRERRRRLWSLSAALRELLDPLHHAEQLAGGNVMLLTGTAGSGKTHLLCDIAKQRVETEKPTVLLMGQRFTSIDGPWVQALQQLDIAALRAEEFIGALEAAAQAANCRALLMIDGLNEGRGRQIWPDNLAAFLAQIERSPWIAVVWSVRSSYEETIVPEAVRERAANIVHEGFSEHEYDATRTFFLHYELELPSTPLLAPEFRNPLFLKTLCKGLQARGDRRLPRGFQGITAIFDLYLTAINARLADNLDFNPKASLVRDALDALCAALSKSGQRWLPMSTAAKIVDAFLPGRDFARSLYRGLVVEGILMEEAGSERQGAKEEVVLISYERFADHLISQSLLDQHLVCDEPAAAFSEGQPLAFLSDKQVYVEPGLIEALCIQVVERTGHELVTLAPKLLDRQGVGDAFLQSLIWRATSAFSEETLKVVQAVSKSAQAISDTIDVLLTVSTLPGHPLNAEFLDQRLRKDTLAERDAWWSIYLHHAWGSRGPVDRLVDWASALNPDAILEEATTDLSAISLAWMLTTSNRFLRDRATKALVSLLVGRLPAAARFVERFSSVDDPYVTERVYAVAYGVAMRCHSKAQLSPLASLVYAKVFKDRDPPAHLLLRDYARGVVERALHLGAELDIDANRIRPPYQSRWQEIPTEEAIQTLLPDWSHDDPDTRQREWARNRIGSSVMSDDFARYVIGTNSSLQSHRWLALRIDEPEWKSPPRPGTLLRELISEFSDEEKQAWDRFIEANNTFKSASQPHVEGWLSNPDEGIPPESSENASSSKIAALKQKMEAALETLDGALTEEHARHLDEIGDAKDNYDKAQISPGFDLKQIQRFILSRVFELGWTTERFGKFDHFSIGDRGREASKAERIGKKYQWIAYHEIMALIADHFQYRERYREDEGDQAYEGPWQDYLRNLDPSCTLRSARGGTGWDSHASSWWGALGYHAWGTPDDLRTWALRWDDLPPVEKLLRVADPTDGSRWLNVQGHFDWKQQPPNDRDSLDVASRELWYSCTGYLIREGDASAFMKWAEGVDFWGNWMPDAPEVYPMFLGEHGWAPAFRYVEHQHYSEGVWIQPKHDCPVKLHPMAFEYLSEASGFDCSVDDTFRLRLPTPTLISGLGLRWNGDADFSDQSGCLVAQDPTARKAGPSALLLREDRLREFLAREKLSMVWTIAGEKRELGSLSSMGGKTPSLRISGAYLLNRQGPAGFLKCMPDDNPETDATAIKILPSP